MIGQRRALLEQQLMHLRASGDPRTQGVTRAKAKAIPPEDRRDVALSAVFVTFAFILSALLGSLLS
ncbi:MAG: hypothetical protein IV100_05640 [Myxococcales bacterium]|nr:hypothetical protein [Myxococcales bacterium]